MDNLIELEQGLLATIIINTKKAEEYIATLSNILKPTDFSSKEGELTYKIILSLFNISKEISLVNILNVAEKNNLAINKDYILHCFPKSSLIGGNVTDIANTILEASKRRKIITLARLLEEKINNPQNESNEAIKEIEEEIHKLHINENKNSIFKISELLPQAFERIENATTNSIPANFLANTGYIELDKILKGFFKSDLVILAARPSQGKTSLAMQLANRVAKQDKFVTIFSLEMSKEQLVDRIIALEAKTAMGKIKSTTEDLDHQKIWQAIANLEERKLLIDDSANLDLTSLRSKMHILKAKNQLDFVIIDYLQLINTNKFKKNEGVTEITRNLKLLAKEFDIPILALSQISRGVEGRDDKRPMLSDLSDSSSIEKDADVVMFIYRDSVYNAKKNKEKLTSGNVSQSEIEKIHKKLNTAEIIVAKHRNGETGTIDLAWVSNYASFEDLDKYN